MQLTLFQLALSLTIVAFSFYLWGHHKGRTVGNKELLDKICQPYEKGNYVIDTVDGCRYAVETRFIAQVIRLERGDGPVFLGD